MVVMGFAWKPQVLEMPNRGKPDQVEKGRLWRALTSDAWPLVSTGKRFGFVLHEKLVRLKEDGRVRCLST